MTVRDLMRGLLVESANDGAVTLAEGVSGSKRAFVRAMNRRAQQLKLTNTHYANPIGLDESGNYSTARDLVRLAVVLRTNRFFRTTTDRPSVRLTTGNRTRTFANRNTLVRSTGWVNGVKSGHTSQAGYVLVGAGRQNHIQLVSAVLGTPSVAARDAATLALLKYGFPRFQQITALRRGTVMTRVPIRYRRGAELALVAGRTVRRIVPRGQRDDVKPRIVGRPDDVTGPVVAGQSFGAVEILQNGRVVGRVPLVAASSVPGGRPRAEGEVLVHQPAAAPARGRRDCRYRPRGSAGAPRRARPAPRRRSAQGRMIITVTLNSAIDKTLSVPNFRLGRRHRTVEQTTMPGGKGVWSTVRWRRPSRKFGTDNVLSIAELSVTVMIMRPGAVPGAALVAHAAAHLRHRTVPPIAATRAGAAAGW